MDYLLWFEKIMLCSNNGWRTRILHEQGGRDIRRAGRGRAQASTSLRAEA